MQSVMKALYDKPDSAFIASIFARLSLGGRKEMGVFGVSLLMQALSIAYKNLHSSHAGIAARAVVMRVLKGRPLSLGLHKGALKSPFAHRFQGT